MKRVKQKPPIHERPQVVRALMRLPLDSEKLIPMGMGTDGKRKIITEVHSPRRAYAERLGIRGETLEALLNRVEGKLLSHEDSGAIARKRIRDDDLVVRRRS